MLHVLVAGRWFEPWFSGGEIPAELRSVFDLDEAASSKETARVTAPGLFAVGGQIGVVLPRCFEPVSDEGARLVAAGHTLRVLRRYLDEESTRRAVLESDLRIAPARSGDTASIFERLEAALLLWEDHRAHGPLPIATRRTSKDARGRIHWPRTIASTVPLVSRLDVIYPDPIRTRHSLDPEHPITRLHAQTVEAAGHFLGALRGHREPRLPSAREALGLLDRHERSLFQDRQRLVAGLLRRYFAPSHRASSGAAREAAGVFAPSFPHVWERMLFVALGSAERPLLPDGKYVLAGGSKGPHGTRFLVDLLVEGLYRGARVQLVLDAKDYQPGKLPPGESIRKQILYRLLLSDRFIDSTAAACRLPLDRIGSAFLGPAVVENAEGLRDQAVHDLTGEQDAVAPLGRIVVLEVDFARTAAAYARGRSDDRLRATVIDRVMTSMGGSSAAAGAFDRSGDGHPLRMA